MGTSYHQAQYARNSYGRRAVEREDRGRVSAQPLSQRGGQVRDSRNDSLFNLDEQEILCKQVERNLEKV